MDILKISRFAHIFAITAANGSHYADDGEMPPEVKKMVDTIQEKAGAAARLIIVPTKLRLSLGTRARLIDDVWNWTVAQTSRVAEAQWLHMQSLVTTEYETPSALQPSQDT